MSDSGATVHSPIQLESAQDTTLHLIFRDTYAETAVYTPNGFPQFIGERVPYAVAILGPSKFFVGDAAKQQPTSNTIYDFLTLLGNKFSETRHGQSRPCPVIQHPTLVDTPAYKLPAPNNALTDTPSREIDTLFTPQQIAIHFIKHLVHEAENSLGKWIRSAVITPPPWFTPSQKTGLTSAVERANLRVVDSAPSQPQTKKPVTPPPTLGFSNLFQEIFKLSPPRRLPRDEEPIVPRSANGSPFREDEESDWECSSDGEAIDVDSPSFEEDEPSFDILDAMMFVTAERLKLIAANAERPEPLPCKPTKRPRNRRRNKKPKTREDNTDDDKGSSSPPTSPTRTTTDTNAPTRVVKTSKLRRRHSSTMVDNPRLGHSKSTPNLPIVPPSEADLTPKKLQFRALITKLKAMFPEDELALDAILHNRADADSTLPVTDALCHVFIDHSNILIGLLNFVDRSPNIHRKGQRHISHSALALVLERGRLTTRRHIVASSPLHQDMDTARELGYDVRVYARVPDTGDGADRLNKNFDRSPRPGHRSHARNMSNTSTDSDTIAARTSLGQIVHGRAFASRPSLASTPAGGSSGRVRYREQGVDELLQLKLHQAIADVDEVPSNSVIVLATGDGNIGQFDDEGFLGPIRTALKKGWNVELYAWEKGLSRAWMHEFGTMDRFRIIALEKFGADLLAVT